MQYKCTSFNKKWYTLYTQSALHLGSLGGHIDVVQTLIDAGAEVDAVDNNKNNPLIVASWKGHLPVVKVLVAKNANVNHHGQNG